MRKCNMGCYSSPLKRNLVPKFTKGGGAQENDEGYVSCGDQRLS
jgi:hypothetical protein